MNVPTAGFCSGCGVQLGLEPVGEAGTSRCPVCSQALAVYRDAGGALLDCAACGGQFVDHVLLREMVRRHDAVALAALGDRGPSFERVPDPRSNYIPCPECAALMNRKNFGGTSGVIVDVCKKHGTWFDPGELPRVLAFIALGGLERARRREEEEAMRIKHDAAVASVTGHALVAWGGEPSSASIRETGLVDFFRHLLG
jgi:Zn-finger nucleic acid-binding protein